MEVYLGAFPVQRCGKNLAECAPPHWSVFRKGRVNLKVVGDVNSMSWTWIFSTSSKRRRQRNAIVYAA
jgi:hypothetical protein